MESVPEEFEQINKQSLKAPRLCLFDVKWCVSKHYSEQPAFPPQRFIQEAP